MGCQSSVIIGDNLTFSITTHDPSSGALTDADNPPVYRLYEDLTGAPLLTGTLPKLDDAGTTGFYAAQVACTLVNGFEEGRSYTIYIEATVLGTTGGICYSFKAETKTGYSTTQADQQASADEFLRRDLATGASVTDRDVQSALRILRNRRYIDLAGVLHVMDETDAVQAWQGNVLTSPGSPVTSIDPA